MGIRKYKVSNVIIQIKYFTWAHSSWIQDGMEWADSIL